MHRSFELRHKNPSTEGANRSLDTVYDYLKAIPAYYANITTGEFLTPQSLFTALQYTQTFIKDITLQFETVQTCSTCDYQRNISQNINCWEIRLNFSM